MIPCVQQGQLAVVAMFCSYESSSSEESAPAVAKRPKEDEVVGQKQTEAFGVRVFQKKLYLTRDLVVDACIPLLCDDIAVLEPAPEPAPKSPAKGYPKGKKKTHVQQFTMRDSLTKKGLSNNAHCFRTACANCWVGNDHCLCLMSSVCPPSACVPRSQLPTPPEHCLHVYHAQCSARAMPFSKQH